MATTGEAQFITAIAAADLTGREYTGVIITTPVNGVPGVTVPGSAGVKALGILAGGADQAAVLTSGSAVKVCVGGKYKASANGDFAQNDALSIAATDGQLDTATVGQYIVADALAAAAAANDIVPVMVRPASTPIVVDTDT